MKVTTGKIVTQADMAARCGVSRSTVAAVLRAGDKARVRPEVRRRIEEAVRTMGYRPHGAARSLRSGSTQMIALAIPNMAAVTGIIASQIFQGIGQQAQVLGYNLLISTYRAAADAQTSFDHMVRESRFDGFFFYGDSHHAEDAREAILSKWGRPFVILEKLSRHGPSLVFDNFRGGFLATEHLIAHGRKRIALIGSGPDLLSCDRYKGYCQALREAGLHIQPQWVFPYAGGFGHSAYEATHRLIKSEPAVDAIFCTTEPAALGCLQALNECGRQVPNDVAVVGYDDTQVSALATPALTAVRQDGVELGQQAMNMLHAIIEGKTLAKPARTLPVQLTIRRSCGCSAERSANSVPS